MDIIELNIKPVIRLNLWILILSLTSVILLFPVHLQFEYHAVESLYIFGNYLWLFAIVYAAWLASLLLLLFTRISEWQRVALVILFALVYLGFWVINTPNGSYADGMANMGHVKYLAQSGIIPFDHPTLAYFQYPGLHLTDLSLYDISSLNIFETSTVILIFCRILLVVLLYTMFAKSLKNPLLGSLAVLFLLHGSILLPRTMFHPAVTAILFFVILLYVLLTRRLIRAAPLMVLFLVTFTALTITYLPLPAFFTFVLGGTYFLQKLKGKTTFGWFLIALCLIILLIWQILWASRMFSGLVGHIQDFLSAFSNPLERLLPIFGTATTSLGESVPLWASLTRIFGLSIVIVFGSILGFRNLIQFRKLESVEIIETGGLWGVLIFCAICIFAFPGGTQQSRVLMYASLFTVPIIIRFLTNIKPPIIFKSPVFSKHPAKSWNWDGIIVFNLPFFAFLCLSLPTFLVNHSSINTETVYSYERRTGEFVVTSYDVESLHFISDILTVYTNAYYVPDAYFNHPPQPWDITDEKTLWQAIDQLIYKYEVSKENAIFVLSERFTQPYRSIAIIEPDPRWLEFTHRLSNNNLIYCNGHYQIYD